MTFALFLFMFLTIHYMTFALFLSMFLTIHYITFALFLFMFLFNILISPPILESMRMLD